MKRYTSIMSVCIGLVFSAVAVAGTPTITNVTRATNHTTLADAIDNADEDDVIEIGAGTLNEWDITLPSSVHVVIRGQGRDQTFIDGGYNGRIFFAEANSSTLEDLTIWRGVAETGSSGSAINVSHNCHLTFRRVDFRDGDGADGLTGVIGRSGSNSSLLFDSCRFVDNFGGSIASVSGGDGVTMINCLLAGNSGGRYTVTGGGQVWANIYNCTFADNLDDYAMRNNIHARNCVIDGSNPDSPVLQIDIKSSLYPGGSGTNTDGLPTFVDAAGGDYRLAGGSLGIDAADDGAYTTVGGGAVDLNGDPRTHDDTGTTDTGVGTLTYLDMGAFEFQGTTTSCGVGDFDCDGDVDLGDFSQFSLCFGGPNVPPAGTCPPGIDADLDNDGDVDLGDFSLFSLNFTGPQ